MSTSHVRDRRRFAPEREPRAARGDHLRRLPGGLVLAVAVAVHAAMLWAEPGLVIAELGAMPPLLREVLRVLAPGLATLLLAAQVMNLLGRLRRHQRRVVAGAAAWWVFAAVESMLADWRSSIWITELALAWLAMNCLRIVARAEARSLSSVARGR
ncbi:MULTISPECIES: hypothetical protein [unclassified Micromonospora]|uniref:hypothetical protein n=1 Tax=unclassified Micromonospora TaxID=2617518 RepID=UPI001C22C9E9|nr:MULTISPECIES: hypothetical protein [unclassified Micromonospora]MBU8860300.1 hypothetical protein [Micromonospora sp. WMMB482]MDM4779834.1 hypothetical protein [Micromonospora sp. b486]